MTGFCFINNLSSWAPWQLSVTITINPRMVAVIFWWQAAVFIGVVAPVYYGVTTLTIVVREPVIVSADIPALVAASATIIFT